MQYAAFPEAEHRERLARTRKLLRDGGFERGTCHMTEGGLELLVGGGAAPLEIV
jgi:hypothetical protein